MFFNHIYRLLPISQKHSLTCFYAIKINRTAYISTNIIFIVFKYSAPLSVSLELSYHGSVPQRYYIVIPTWLQTMDQYRKGYYIVIPTWLQTMDRYRKGYYMVNLIITGDQHDYVDC